MIFVAKKTAIACNTGYTKYYSVELVAERADISRATLWKVEKGDETVAIGIYAAVLHALNGMDKD